MEEGNFFAAAGSRAVADSAGYAGRCPANPPYGVTSSYATLWMRAMAAATPAP